MSHELQGKTALVTGGGRGLGRAIAEKLAASGVLVAVNYASNHDAAARTVAAIESRGGAAFAVQAELGAPGFTAGETNEHVIEDSEQLQAVVAATALRRFGQPEEIADIVHALASPAGRWITSQNIDASGGFKL